MTKRPKPKEPDYLGASHPWRRPSLASRFVATVCRSGPSRLLRPHTAHADGVERRTAATALRSRRPYCFSNVISRPSTPPGPIRPLTSTAVMALRVQPFEPCSLMLRIAARSAGTVPAHTGRFYDTPATSVTQITSVTNVRCDSPALVDQSRELVRARRDGAVGADDSMPGDVMWCSEKQLTARGAPGLASVYVEISPSRIAQRSRGCDRQAMRSLACRGSCAW
jgi:hypothetical protein